MSTPSPDPRRAVAALDPAEVVFRNPLPRLTNKVFTDLAIWMVGFGLVMGVAFPFFVIAFKVPSRYVMTPVFFVATVGAGLLVGATNHTLSRVVVRSRLRFMRAKMSIVEETLRRATRTHDADLCTPEKCSIPIDSDDEIGETAASFNHLVEALAASHQAMHVARRFANTLSSHIELTPLVEAALNELRSAGDYSAAALCILDEGQLTTVASSGIVEPDRLASTQFVQESYRTLDTARLELPDDLLLDGGMVTFKPRSVAAYPLHIRLVPIGVMVLASTKPISDDEHWLIQQLMPNFAVALNNALSHERLQRVAAIDTLTGLYNRRFGLERLGQEFSRSVRSKEPLGVVLFDIDHFKAVNDTYGHQTGDLVLKMVADAVKGVLREGDTLIRYGGEEFVAVLPAAGEADVRGLGERIRRVVESSKISDGAVELEVTVSIGALSVPNVTVADIDDLIRQVDAAMYDAKKAGRNRLSFAAA